jgi:hypothetical protein
LLRIVFASTVTSVGAGIVAGLALSLALNKVMALWAEESSRDPLLLAASTLPLASWLQPLPVPFLPVAPPPSIP